MTETHATDWYAMQPGPELDARVAERVLGWRRHSEGEWVDADATPQLGGVPPFSTDIAAAWQVVEAMSASASVDVMFSPDADEPWTVRFPMGPDVPESHRHVHGETAPLAICRAALMVAEVAGP